MPNAGRPLNTRRRFQSAAVRSKLLYGAEIWTARVTSMVCNRAALNRPLRTVALRIIRTYRTVSTEATQFLAAIPPADLLAEERARVATRAKSPAGQVMKTSIIKKEERVVTMVEWQHRWSVGTSTDAWTFRIRRTSPAGYAAARGRD